MKTTGVVFLVNGLSANGDDTPRGDAPNAASLSVAVGCSGRSYYLDQDGDGYGTSDPSFVVLGACSPPEGYSAQSGDCNDFVASIHPGGPELCDRLDNNCDESIDENVVYQPYCEDKDGDGHGVPGGATKNDCAPSVGFGDCQGDCNDLATATTYLHDVGCESCHGPSVRHVRSVDKRHGTSRRVDPMVCLGCHTPEQNIAPFDYATALKEVLGPGHGAAASGDSGSALH